MDSELSQAKQDSGSESSPGLKKRPPVIEEELASSITRDICRGLFKIHSKNFIHRDLKPENIMIHEFDTFTEEELKLNPGKKFEAKIADFGLTAEVNDNVFRGYE